MLRKADSKGPPGKQPRDSSFDLTPAFRHKVFTALWLATVVSNIGGWMYV